MKAAMSHRKQAVKLNAAKRLLATATWHGKFDPEFDDMPHEIRSVIEETMNRVCKDYHVLANINIVYGDSALMNQIDQLATKSFTAIILNPHYWMEHGHLVRHAKEWHEAVVDASISGLILHECGHILDGLALRKLGSKKYNAILSECLQDVQNIWNNDSPSAYGQENIFEFMAEAFVAHYLGRAAIPNDLGRQALAVCQKVWDRINKVIK